MSLHVFVDESRRGSLYLLAAAVLRPKELASTRSLMRGLRVPGARKVHFKHERDTVQKDVAAALVLAGVRTRLYLGYGKPEAVRGRVLRALVADLVTVGMRRLVLDSRGHEGDQSDRRIIQSTLAGAGAGSGVVSYEHLRSHEEPVLWVADAVAWCYGAGGVWRQRVDPIVDSVTELGRR